MACCSSVQCTVYCTLFCLERPILWPPRILTFPPGTLCIAQNYALEGSGRGLFDSLYRNMPGWLRSTRTTDIPTKIRVEHTSNPPLHRSSRCSPEALHTDTNTYGLGAKISCAASFRSLDASRGQTVGKLALVMARKHLGKPSLIRSNSGREVTRVSEAKVTLRDNKT
jgi:hypothetical protein